MSPFEVITFCQLIWCLWLNVISETSFTCLLYFASFFLVVEIITFSLFYLNGECCSFLFLIVEFSGWCSCWRWNLVSIRRVGWKWKLSSVELFGLRSWNLFLEVSLVCYRLRSWSVTEIVGLEAFRIGFIVIFWENS